MHELSIHLHLLVYISCLHSSVALSPLSEFSIEETIGESLSADTDALQYSIAPQLVEYKMCVYQSSFLQFIGNDAPHKVGCGVAWCGQTSVFNVGHIG